MSIDGHVQIAIDFNDSDSDSSCDTLKKIRLSSSNAVTAGKVAIASGTVGTAVISFGPIEAGGFLDGYRDAAGDFVAFESITGFAFQSDGLAYAKQSAQAYPSLVSDNDEVTYTRVSQPDVGEYINVAKVSAGTCNYSLMIYGT